MKKFFVLTLFPEACAAYVNASLLGRAQKKKVLKVNLINIRDFAADKHKKVDDSPYGGGPGMVMKVEPIYKATQFIKSKVENGKSKVRVILFSTRGKIFDQKAARRLARYDTLIFICGRYEGVDERVAEHIADEEISMGDFVLSGGELPALTVIEAVSRHVRGVLGKEESLEEIKGSYPVYTRPEIFKIKNKRAKGKLWKVPEALLSGNHKKIAAWREMKSRRRASS